MNRKIAMVLQAVPDIQRVPVLLIGAKDHLVAEDQEVTGKQVKNVRN